MLTILVDTSVWIDFFKGGQSPASIYLKSNLDSCVIATCPVIVQEVLQGIRDDKQFTELKHFFINVLQLPETSSIDIAIQAAELYRRLRRLGATIRKPNDCLIACYAINHDIPLLYSDRDFEVICKYSNLKPVMDARNLFEEDAEPYAGMP